MGAVCLARSMANTLYMGMILICNEMSPSKDSGLIALHGGRCYIAVAASLIVRLATEDWTYRLHMRDLRGRAMKLWRAYWLLLRARSEWVISMEGPFVTGKITMNHRSDWFLRNVLCREKWFHVLQLQGRRRVRRRYSWLHRCLVNLLMQVLSLKKDSYFNLSYIRYISKRKNGRLISKDHLSRGITLVLIRVCCEVSLYS